MTTIGLAGAGTIGMGLVQLLSQSPAARGLRLKTILVRDLAKPRKGIPGGILVTDRIEDLTDDPEIDVVVELLGGVEDSFRLVAWALAANKPVVTANKNLLAERGPELFALAAQHGVPLGFEASVCAGLPIVRTLQEALKADSIRSLEGIVNGTTNYLLTRMAEEKIPYLACLAEAQRLGLAEPDPDYDVSGEDAACKTGILATLAFGAYVDFRKIPTAGIENLDLEDIGQAEAMGFRIKLLASARKDPSGDLDVEVGPVLVPLDHPLASVRREFNAILIDSAGLGQTMVTGKGAGPAPTAVSLLSDILDIAEGRARVPSDDHPFLGRPFDLSVRVPSPSRFYIRLTVPDRPGVLSQVAGLFAGQGISLASVLQPEGPDTEERTSVSLILTTHATNRGCLDKVLGSLTDIGWGRHVVLRIQEQ